MVAKVDLRTARWGCTANCGAALGYKRLQIRRFVLLSQLSDLASFGRKISSHYGDRLSIDFACFRVLQVRRSCG